MQKNHIVLFHQLRTPREVVHSSTPSLGYDQLNPRCSVHSLPIITHITSSYDIMSVKICWLVSNKYCSVCVTFHTQPITYTNTDAQARERC